MTSTTFAETMSAIEQNVSSLTSITKYPADNLQNLQNITYLVSRISDLTSALTKQVEADIANLTSHGAGEPFNEWIDLYQQGKLTPAEFVSEMEFDGFDGDLTDFL